MSFKNGLLFIIGIIFLSSTACNLKTGDWVPPGDHGKLIGPYDCLSNVAGETRDFINGELGEGKIASDKIANTLGCVKEALLKFNEIGRGASKDGFLPVELSGFLNEVFLKDSQITAELLKELMEIKVVVAGGSDNFVTKKEFDQLIELTETLKLLAVRTAPHMKLYRNMLSEETKKQLSPRTLREAKDALEFVAVVLGERLENSAGSYKVSSIKKLIEHSRIFLKWDVSNPEAKSTEEMAELFEVFKLFVVGSKINDDEEVIAPKQWINLFSGFSQGYGIYLDYTYKLKDAYLMAGQGLADFVSAISGKNGIFVSLRNAINNQPESVIKFDLLDRVFAVASKLDILPEGLRLQESIIPSARYIIEKIMRDLSIPLDDAKSEGLRVNHVREMEKEFLNWAYGQHKIARRYKGNSVTPDLVLAKPNAALKKSAEAEVVNLIQNENLREMYASDADARVWITPPSDRKHSFQGLTRLNVIKSFARLLIRGFAKEPARAKAMSGITSQEAVDFYAITKNLGVDLEYMDERKSNVGARFFIEANLLTFSGNGIREEDDNPETHLLTFQEATEQLALVYSGSVLRDLIYKDALEHTVEHQIADNGEMVFSENIAKGESHGKVILDRNKFLNRIATESYKKIDNLPLMVNYLEDMSLEERRGFFGSMLDLAHHPGVDRNDVEYGELATVATLLHYIEIVFHRYDTNFDGTMVQGEVMRAYSNFRIFIEREDNRMTGLERTIQQYKAAFVYLLAYGERPEGTGAQAKILWWTSRFFNDDVNEFDGECARAVLGCRAPNLEVRRERILGILGFLAESTRSRAAD